MNSNNELISLSDEIVQNVIHRTLTYPNMSNMLMASFKDMPWAHLINLIHCINQQGRTTAMIKVVPTWPKRDSLLMRTR